MDFTIDGIRRAFTPIRQFRAEQGLEDAFGVSLFVHKDFAGLGSIEHAALELQQVKQAVLNAIPDYAPPQGWSGFALELQWLFLRHLNAINPAVGLRRSEIEYAVAGFGEVMQQAIFALISPRTTDQSPPSFDDLYHAWLTRTIQRSGGYAVYPHHGDLWKIYLLKNAYGRFGLIIHTLHCTHYVYDAQIACPAQGYMYGLLDEAVSKAARVIKTAAL